MGKQSCRENGREIKNIKCDAKNCIHHTPDCHCKAGSIEIGCCDAEKCSDTVCSTFEAVPEIRDR